MLVFHALLAGLDKNHLARTTESDHGRDSNVLTSRPGRLPLWELSLKTPRTRRPPPCSLKAHRTSPS
ncbi:hypothetical protein M407DRAFT_241665 [Tulasnella calospora MUT 4182]|uniref:Uncharacterized protein n=1 Tax=Tulasnella calospora MUT 4182 TaxID=1051891 RepID=A0A0C3LCS1_9AGAM|nr:hypothetical protein M407DRAFT_241665 [Tulasnella calospora MUT 4182]